jgi:predicted RNase H-like HicB family nuclease
MTRSYMVVYEQGPANWSAFVPDIPGCGSLGNEIEDTRSNVREAIELYLVESAKAGEPIPEALANSVNFQEFDPNPETKKYFVEWLSVALPQSIAPRSEDQAA